MINKNKLIIIPVLAVSALFLLSNFSKSESELSPTQSLKEETYTKKSFKFEVSKKQKKKTSFKLNTKFAKSLHD